MTTTQVTAHFALSTDDGLAFRWRGGAYIEVGHEDGDGFHAVEVINVYDYAAGTPSIPQTLDAFRDRCLEWITDAYLEEVADAADDASEDAIRVAFGMVSPPSSVDASSEPTADEIAAVRALLGSQG